MTMGRLYQKEKDCKSESDFYYYRISAKKSENEAFRWDRSYQQMKGGRDLRAISLDNWIYL